MLNTSEFCHFWNFIFQQHTKCSDKFRGSNKCENGLVVFFSAKSKRFTAKI